MWLLNARGQGVRGKGNYVSATPEQVAEAVLGYRTQPNMRDSERFVNPTT